MEGWIKLHRKTLENPIVCKDGDHIAVWMYILLNATHKEYPAVFGGNKIMLQPGQLITGRKVISEKFKISESKVQRILKLFENEQQIEQQNGNKNRLISVVSWSDYQESEQQDEQQLNNNRTTTEQQLNTNKNVKNIKNVKEDIKDSGTKVPKRFIPPTIEQVIEYCLERQNNVDPEKWMNHYTSNGWKVGKNGMKDWKAAVRTWEKNSGGFGITTFKTKSSEFQDQIDMMKNRIGGTAYEEASATGSRTDITPHQDGISEFYLNTGRSRHMDNDADWSRYGNGDGEF